MNYQPSTNKWHFGLPTQAWFLKKRKKRRTLDPSIVRNIPNLQLWLDAGLGTFKTWDAAPLSGSGSLSYGIASDYVASGITHSIRIFPFKFISGLQVFSFGFLDLWASDDSSLNPYGIEWAWDPVPGAEGYRILKSDPSHGLSFDYSTDVAGTGFLDTSPNAFVGDPTVIPNDLGPAGDGDPVYLWQDQSANQNDAGQGTWTKRPSLISGVANGKPVLRFDPVDDGMITTFGFNQTLTAFVVYAYNNTANLPQRALQGRTANWLIGPYGLQYTFYTGGWMLTGPAITPGTFVVQTGWQTATEARNYINGSLASTHAGPTTAPGPLGLALEGAFLEPLDGDIAEVLVYSRALSDIERETVENYLKQKYSIL